ncbi:hypothetical protein KC946_00285 [Candidatus Saccharibacteria bacterium]|nr:hypothetical protein [Candidatus Saccharibacteria bacterium]
MPKTKTKSKRKSTKTKTSKSKYKRQPAELDSVYILKLTVYLILSSQWIHFTTTAGSGGMNFSLPLGAVLGLLLATHDRFKIDRKIEYAVILIAMLIGFWLPTGLSVVI